MANYYGIKLSRAIRERAYAAGEVERKAAEVATLQAALKEARRQLKAANGQLERRDKEIAGLSAIDTGSIRPIQHVPKSGQFKFGELSRTIIQILKDAGGKVLETRDIVVGVSESLGLDIDERHWATARRRVVKQLQAYARKGAIERLHDPASTDTGRWRWTGI